VSFARAGSLPSCISRRWFHARQGMVVVRPEDVGEINHLEEAHAPPQ